jgi:alkane 1-monooxygenase
MSAALDAARPALPPEAYRDHKRWAWWLSLWVPLSVLTGPALMLWTGQAWTLWLPVVFNYGVVPLLDLLLGEDRSNPPEGAVPALEADPYYRRITWALVPLLWAAFIFCAWFVSRQTLPGHGVLAMVLIGGAVGGFAINLGHELGHKRAGWERRLATLVLLPFGYGHFNIEHNRGHHRDVATPQDPASSRMGESIYRFVWREIPGAAVRAWGLERRRLLTEGLGPLSWHNEILRAAGLTLLFWAGLVLWLGLAVLPFVVAMSAWAWFQLTSANYIEHYGLLRRVDAQGKLEPCQPHHSWNSNHVFSNWALFHLQRHSDHHAHPLRRYQSLRDFEGLPRLPNGYFGMFLVAYLPPLWFRVMDPRLLAAVQGDVQRINFQPGRREALIRRYGLAG